MNMKTTLLAGVVFLGAALGTFTLVDAASEKPSETLKRTQHYTKLLGTVQEAQDKLNLFIEGEQKGCQSKGSQLQQTPQGMLACVVPPPPPAVKPPAPTPQK